MLLQNASRCSQNLTLMTKNPFSIAPTFACLTAEAHHTEKFLLKYFPKKHGHGNLQNLGDVKVFSNSNIYHFKCNGSAGKVLLNLLGPEEGGGLLFGDAPVGGIANATIFFTNDGHLPIKLKKIIHQDMENHIKVQFKGIQDHKRLKQKLIDVYHPFFLFLFYIYHIFKKIVIYHIILIHTHTNFQDIAHLGWTPQSVISIGKWQL